MLSFDEEKRKVKKRLRDIIYRRIFCNPERLREIKIPSGCYSRKEWPLGSMHAWTWAVIELYPHKQIQGSTVNTTRSINEGGDITAMKNSSFAWKCEFSLERSFVLVVSAIPFFPKTFHLKSLFHSLFQCNPKPHRWPITTEPFWLLLNCFHLIYCFISVADSGLICSPLLKSFHLLQSIAFKICKPGPTQKNFFIIDSFRSLVCSPGALSALL